MAATYRYKGKRYTLEQMLAKRKRRRALPDEALPPEMLARRQRASARRRANRNPLYDPMKPLAGKRLKKVANQLTDLELNPQISAIERRDQAQGAQATALQGRAGDYYMKLAQEAQGGLTRQTALNQRLAQGATSAAAATQGALDHAGQQVAQESIHDADIRGGGLDQQGQATLELARARALAAQQASIAQTEAGRQGAAGETLLNTIGSTVGLRGGEVQERLALARLNQSHEAQQEIGELRANRGKLFTSNVMTLRDKGFENEAIRQGIIGDRQELAFKAQEAAASRQHQVRLQKLANRARWKIEQRKLAANDAERAKYDLTAAEKAALEREKIRQRDRASSRSNRDGGGGGGGRPMSASQLTSRKQIISAVRESGTGKMLVEREDANGNPALKEVDIRGLSVTAVTRKLVANGMPRLEARAAAEIAKNGRVSTETQDSLRMAGIRLPRRYRHRASGVETYSGPN